MFPKCFKKIAAKPNNYECNLPSFRKFCDNISYKVLRPSEFLEKVMEILELSTNKSDPYRLPIL